MSESTQISCAIEIESMEQRRTQRLGVGQRCRFIFSPHSAWLSGIKKPACGRRFILSSVLIYMDLFCN